MGQSDNNRPLTNAEEVVTFVFGSSFELAPVSQDLTQTNGTSIFAIWPVTVDCPYLVFGELNSGCQTRAQPVRVRRSIQPLYAVVCT